MKNQVPCLCLASTLHQSERGLYFLTQAFWPRVFNAVEICSPKIPPLDELKSERKERIAIEIEKSDFVLAVLDWPVVDHDVSWVTIQAEKAQLPIIGYRDSTLSARYRKQSKSNEFVVSRIERSGGVIADDLNELVDVLRHRARLLYAAHTTT
jgi:hypothetical protein